MDRHGGRRPTRHHRLVGRAAGSPLTGGSAQADGPVVPVVMSEADWTTAAPAEIGFGVGAPRLSEETVRVVLVANDRGPVRQTGRRPRARPVAEHHRLDHQGRLLVLPF